MDRYATAKRRGYAGSYYRSGALFFGALLFSLSQLLGFIQLFRDAAARKSANQRPPEDFTAGGITRYAIVLAVVLLVTFLVWRYRKGRLRMRKQSALLLTALLLTAWSVYEIVQFVSDLELTQLLPAFGVAVGVAAPVVLLAVSDIRAERPNDAALLILGVVGMLLAAGAFAVLLLLRAGYEGSQTRLTSELMLRGGMALFSFAALQKALQLRDTYPAVTRETPAVKRREAPDEPPRRREREDAPPRRAETAQEVTARMKIPREALREETRSLRLFAEEGFDDEDSAPAPYARAGHAFNVTPTWDTGRIIVQGGTGRLPTQDPGRVPSERQTCPDCGKRMPLGFPNCPRCGRSM